MYRLQKIWIKLWDSNVHGLYEHHGSMCQSTNLDSDQIPLKQRINDAQIMKILTRITSVTNSTHLRSLAEHPNINESSVSNN